MNPAPKYFYPILHLLAFCSIAIAQPILDLVSSNPELLIAQQVESSEIIVVVAFLMLVIPLLISIPYLLSKLLSVKFSNIIFLATLGLLVTILAMMMVKRWFDLADIVLLLLSIVASLCFLFLYWRQEAVRLFCTYLSPAILLVPILFLVGENVRRTVFVAAESIEVAEVAEDSNLQQTPVIVVVFDELPVISLLDRNLEIDRVRFPNFARLRDDSHWFRNTHTVSSVTTLATPALLSGSLNLNTLPIAADHPQNLFTLLESTHELRVWEIVTRLCSSSKCNAAEGTGRDPVLRGFLSDLAIVYLHVISPPQFSQRLPVISQSWSNFGNSNEELMPLSFNEFAVTDRANSRVAEFRDFVQSIDSANALTLYFHHSLLPHMPWELLPSGNQYSVLGSRVLGLDEIEDRWGQNSNLVNQGYQRHLLQTVSVDNLLGELLDQLEQEDIYDDALVVVTSDHGANFWPNNVRRDNSSEINKYDVELVPLFIKLPNQDGNVSHVEAVSTVDVFPTIASILEKPLPFATQGVDLFGDRQRSSIPQLMEGELSADNFTLAHKISLFGEGEIDSIYNIGPLPQFIGAETASLNSSMAEKLSYELNQQAYLRSVNPASKFTPSWLTGSIANNGADLESEQLLFAFNGTVVGSAESYEQAEQTLFSILIPEESIQAGINELELFTVAINDQGVPVVEQIANASDRVFQYAVPGDRTSTQIVEQNGTSLELATLDVRGDVDVFRQADDLISFSVWAITTAGNLPLDYLLLDVNGSLMYLGSPEIDRPDIVEFSGDSAALRSGWQFTLPGSDQLEIAQTSLRLLGVSGESVAEIKTMELINYNSEFYSFNNADLISSADGETISVDGSDPVGALDLARVRNNVIDLEGWATDLDGSNPADYFLLDNGGALYDLGSSEVVRADLVAAFNEPNLLGSGFVFRIPLLVLEEAIQPEIRLLAVTAGEAIEVNSAASLYSRLSIQ